VLWVRQRGLEMDPHFLDRSPAYLAVKGAVQPDALITADTIQILRVAPLPYRRIASITTTTVVTARAASPT
jgi:hypothetical protein